MTNERSIALVFGYLPEIDDAYEPAQKLGLSQRFAVALDSYRASKEYEDMYFDSELMHRILMILRDILAFDRMRIRYTENCEREMSREFSAEDLAFSEEQDPFEQLSFISGDRVSCLVRLEPYTSVGGPYPYHDTHCFSFYVAGVNEDAVRIRIEGFAEEEHLVLRDVLHGGTVPQISFLTKLKRLL